MTIADVAERKKPNQKGKLSYTRKKLNNNFHLNDVDGHELRKGREVLSNLCHNINTKSKEDAPDKLKLLLICLWLHYFMHKNKWYI